MSLLLRIEDVLPFTGLPLPVQALFVTALLLSLTQLAAVLQLTWRSIREQHRREELQGSYEPHDESAYLWVFMVPALNEAVTIRDTVDRLTRIEASNKVFIIINDGSTDETGDILAAYSNPDLRTMTRVAPNARLGKAAALNAAWADLSSFIDPEVFARFGDERTLVVIVDADGRLDADFADGVAERFNNPKVGGVQLAVRIYNRRHPLAYMQDVEFRMFGSTFQLGRSSWGTAGMGGNGQINRLRALDEIGAMNIAAGSATGPWRDRLTEDQDLGLSLIECGWANRQEMIHAVNQQGLSNYRRLFRQRVRWCQGNMQAIARWQGMLKAPITKLAKVDAMFWLAQPIVQTLIGISLTVAIGLVLYRPHYLEFRTHIVVLMIFLCMSLGGTFIAVLRAQTVGEGRSLTKGFLLLIPYLFYCYCLLPIYFVAWFRQIRRQRNWVKTEREVISLELDEAGSGA
jgi:cellulose synthase/poly-beta-1,6-N-acetylglucosamine synthase-like glycosyltransferase